MSTLEVRVLPELAATSDLGAQWEALVCANTGSGFMQSLQWALFKRNQGLISLHVGVIEENCLIGGAIFYAPKNGNGAGILVAPEGPVLPWNDQEKSSSALRLIMSTVESHSREMGVMAVRVEPRLCPPQPFVLRDFGRAPVDLIPRHTMYVDLSQPIETMLSGMKPKGRYNINLAERHGVSVYEDRSPEAVQRFYLLVHEASIRDDFALEPCVFFDQLSRALCPSGVARFLFSEHEGELLGTMLLITYGSRATYLYGGISNNKRNLMAGYALQWEAMKTARELGCTVYDFYGYEPIRAPQLEYARFSQFKSQFGGNPVNFIGAQDHFFLDCLADAFIKAVGETSNFGRLASAIGK